MKKILAALLVLALGMPALAAVDVTWTDMGAGHLRITVAPTGGAAVRGVALKLTRTAGDAAIQAATSPKATVTQLNTNIDYAFSNAGYTIGAGHPLAKPDQAGELVAFPASTFSLCSGYLDQSGGKAGLTVDSFFDIFYTASTTSTITIALDPLRGGIVGDTLGTVTVNSPATLFIPTGYTLTTSSTDGGDVIVPGEGAYPDLSDLVAIQASDPDAAGYYWVGWTGASVAKVTNPALKSTTILMDADAQIQATWQAETITLDATPITKITAAPAIAGRINGSRPEIFVGAATSSMGHTLQYEFDWGGGPSGVWDVAQQSHTFVYAALTTYNVKVRARCQAHPAIISGWSAALPEVTEAVKSTAAGAGRPAGEAYAAWALFGRLDCWAFQRNCRGDADNILNPAGKGGIPPAHWVGSPDLIILASAWQKADADLTGNKSCADFDRIQNPAGKGGIPPAHWVGSPDLIILAGSWQKAEVDTPVCDQANYWYWTN